MSFGRSLQDLLSRSITQNLGISDLLRKRDLEAQELGKTQMAVGDIESGTIRNLGTIRANSELQQNENQRGALGTIGSIGGAMIGAAFGGPAGASIGGTLGGALGTGGLKGVASVAPSVIANAATSYMSQQAKNDELRNKAFLDLTEKGYVPVSEGETPEFSMPLPGGESSGFKRLIKSGENEKILADLAGKGYAPVSEGGTPEFTLPVGGQDVGFKQLIPRSKEVPLSPQARTFFSGMLGVQESQLPQTMDELKPIIDAYAKKESTLLSPDARKLYANALGVPKDQLPSKLSEITPLLSSLDKKDQNKFMNEFRMMQLDNQRQQFVESLQQRAQLAQDRLRAAQDKGANTENKTRAAFDLAYMALNEIEAMDKQVTSSQFKLLNWGMNKVKEAFGNQTVAAYEQQSSLAAKALASALEGGRISDQDFRVYKETIVPSVNDAPNVRATKIGKLREVLNKAANTKPGTYSVKSSPAPVSTNSRKKFNPRTGRVE